MADNNGGFLGGGPQFNKVGAPAPTDGTEVDGSATKTLQPYQIRNAVVVVVILALVAVLFFMNDHQGGVIHKQGRGGSTSDQTDTSTPSTSSHHYRAREAVRWHRTRHWSPQDGLSGQI